jgi:hypothetical protein
LTLPAEVVAVCDTFLATVPEGLVTGLYLRGGLGFGEWVPGQSDVDFVATLASRPTAVDVAALERAHEVVRVAHPGTPFDGPHLLAADLVRPATECPDVPCVLHHFFEDERPVHDGVVAWHELARHGITVAGPPHEDLGIWTDDEALRDFTRTNLDTYWRRNAEALAEMPSEGAKEEACSWCVLGVARLHHLLVTGEMTTKNGAGEWGLTHYPDRFHRVLREALRIRSGGGDEYLGDDGARGADTAELTAYVVARGTEGG